MANLTISDLAPADALTGTELLLLTQGGNSRRISLADLVAAIGNLAAAQTYAMPFRGAMLTRTSDLTNVSFPLFMPWQDAEYDTDGFWSLSDPTKLIIPAGVTKVRLYGGIHFSASPTSTSLFFSIYRNGSENYPGSPTMNFRTYSQGWSDNVFTISSPPIQVTAGDYFELRANRHSSGSFDSVNASGRTFFAVEVVEAPAP